MKIPLAWLQLRNEKIRLLIALAGIGFADMLMFMQLGFQSAFLSSSVKLHKALEGDIFLMSAQSSALIYTETFSERDLYKSLAVKQVESVVPIYLDFGLWKNPINHNTKLILTIAFAPVNNILNLPGIDKNIDKVNLENYVLFDEKSRIEFGDIPKLLEHNNTINTELNYNQITVGGLFSSGLSISVEGNILTSDTNFFNLFPNRQQGLVDIGLIKLMPNANLETTLLTLKNQLPKNIRVFSKEEFIQYEIKYWKDSTAIGFIFGLGTLIGFVVGTVIVYQILYTDVTNHLAEYATLKAMGFKNSYFIVVIFQEAIILAILGFIPGFLIAQGLYFLAANSTGLSIFMTLSRSITVLILTVMMCCVSGSIAIRKLNAADPADIF